MLGKLIKHEWKDMCKVGAIMALVVLVVTIIGCIMLHMPGMTELFSENSTLSDTQLFGWAMMAIVSFIAYVFLLMAVTYGILIYSGVHFYKTMYTDQGYLTNTLPVTPHQLLISKICVSGVWYLIVEIVVYASILALVFSMFSGVFAGELAQQGLSVWETLARLYTEVTEVYAEIGLDMVRFIAMLGIISLIIPFTAMATLFGSITIGQLSKKHKALMGILAYLGVTFLSMIVASAVQMVSTFKYSFALMANPDTQMNMNTTYDVSFVLSLLFAVVLYFVGHYILSKKLNMD